MKRNLGCLSLSAFLSALTTLFLLAGVAFASGSQMFSAGGLNAETGQTYGGVNSHAQITDCSACHAAPWSADSMADRCASCHTDISAQMFNVAKFHGAILQKDGSLACRDCHPEHRGATASLTDTTGIVFPHEALGFSLNGHQHKAGNEAFICSDCHADDIKTFASDSCQNCHGKMDMVFTQAHILSFGTNCLGCHDGVDRFGDDFTHSVFAFKLVGKHANVVCSKCHLDARTVVDLQSAPQDCFSCHSADDEHDGRFGQDCGGCHSVEGWKPAKFDHNLADFKLVGKHVEVACQDCHKDGTYRGTPLDCYSCHQSKDEHKGQFGVDCSICHNANDWNDVNVDHNLFAFKLEGNHVSVKCESCHLNGIFKGTPTDCFSCHANIDEHNGRFGTDCSACHNTVNWKDATFDHNLSNFPLTGAHVSVACEKCHTDGQFKGLSTNCASCHADPGFHSGAFGLNCAACHSVSAWLPASYGLSHPGIANEGGSGINHGGASCRTCHPASVYQSTCLSCHDSNKPGDGGGGGD